MKKKCTGIDHTLLLSEFKHTCRVMKLILSFLLLCVSTVFSENVSSQIARVNIVANKLSVKEIIKQIEDQTDYLFVYSNEKVDLSHRVSLNASDISVISSPAAFLRLRCRTDPGPRREISCGDIKRLPPVMTPQQSFLSSL